ncbi:MAG: Rrf2 family transcriptional regulator [Acidiferrobacteraceae bacterium]
MKLTTKGRYAVTAMLDLALHRREQVVSLSDIAARQDISLAYLEQLFARLRRSGLVESVRGPGGGYQLSLPPAEISVAEIIIAIDENIDATRCHGEENCHGDERCLTHQLWQELSERIYAFLDETTLGDLISRPAVQEVALRQKMPAGLRVEAGEGR